MGCSEVVTGCDSEEERAVEAEDLFSVHCGHTTNVDRGVFAHFASSPNASGEAINGRLNKKSVNLKDDFKSTLPFRVYSNRAPAAVAQKVAILLSLASKTSTTEWVVNSSPLSPSSKVAVTFWDPMKRPPAS